MDKVKHYALLQTVSVWSVLILFSVGGCDSTDKPRFTDEELAKIPPVASTNLPEFLLSPAPASLGPRSPDARRGGGQESMGGGLTLVVGNEVVTADEVTELLTEQLGPMARRADFEEFKRYARPEVERLAKVIISERILYQQAKKQAQEGIDEALDKAADKEVKAFLSEFGGNYARAEEKLKQGGFNWQSFREYKRKQILTQWYLSTQLADDSPVTHSELREYYEAIKDEHYAAPAQIKFRLIDIRPAQLAGGTPDAAELKQAKAEARELAEQLAQRIKAGEDFGELAKKYSHGLYASQGGFWDPPPQPGSLAAPYDVIETVLQALGPGEISRPIETDKHIFIIKLESAQLQGYKPFEQVQADVEQRLLFDRRREKGNRLLAKLARYAQGPYFDSFIDLCLRKIYEQHHK